MLNAKSAHHQVSPKILGARLILAAMMGGLGFMALKPSIALLLPSDQVETAHRLDPNNAAIASRLSLRLLQEGIGENSLLNATRVAEQALRNDPTAVMAVTALATDAFLQGDEAKGNALLAYAHKLSRRDLAAHVMAIEIAIARNDIPTALQHYDLALRTKAEAANMLFPILTEALPYPEIATGLSKLLANNPAWGQAFLAYAVKNTEDLSGTIPFFLSVKSAKGPISEAASAHLLNRLLKAKRHEEAWAFYAAGNPTHARTHSRDPQFQNRARARSAFDWVALNGLGIATAVLSGPSNGLFDFSVSMGSGGPLLQQLQMLPAGTYRLEGQSRHVEPLSDAAPYWVLKCQSGFEIGRVELAGKSNGNGHFQGQLQVPSDCPVQMLTLVARATDSIGGQSGQITRVQLHPVKVASDA